MFFYIPQTLLRQVFAFEDNDQLTNEILSVGLFPKIRTKLWENKQQLKKTADQYILVVEQESQDFWKPKSVPKRNMMNTKQRKTRQILL